MSACMVCWVPGGSLCASCYGSVLKSGVYPPGTPKRSIAPPEETLYMEPIIGWRWWWIPNGSERLTTGQPSIQWEPRQPFVAEHQRRPATPLHDSPVCTDPPCDGTCGIYAWKDQATLIDAGRRLFRADRYVFGPVYLWGRVIEHQRGYRAQFAYPKAIVCSTFDTRETKALADTYNIPYLEHEADQWKSEFRLDESLPSPYTFPSPYGLRNLSSQSLLSQVFLSNNPLWYLPPNQNSSQYEPSKAQKAYFDIIAAEKEKKDQV